MHVNFFKHIHMDTREDFLATTADGDKISTGWLVDAKSGGKDIAPGSQVRIDPEQLEAARLLAGPDGIGVLFQKLAAGQVLEVREVTRAVFEWGGGDFIVSGLPDGTFSSNLPNLPDDYIPPDLSFIDGSTLIDPPTYLSLTEDEA